MAKPGTPVNETEAFVFRVCRKTFLSVWCSSNPVAEPGKELCDVLIVCDPHVIIISVKDVRLREGDLEVEHARWERKAVDDSAKQIYGAERWLSTASQVVQGDGLPGLSLPPVAWRRVHRIAVAFGGRGEVVVASGDFGKGFVHVMTEHSFLDVLKELDTISDLVEYLAAKEAFLAKCRVVAEGSEAIGSPDAKGVYHQGTVQYLPRNPKIHRLKGWGYDGYGPPGGIGDFAVRGLIHLCILGFACFYAYGLLSRPQKE